METQNKKKLSRGSRILRGLSLLVFSALLLGALLPPLDVLEVPDVPMPTCGRGAYCYDNTPQPDLAELKEAVQRLSERNNHLRYQLEFANGLKPFNGWAVL